MLTCEVVIDNVRVNYRPGSLRWSKATGQRSTFEFEIRSDILTPTEGQEAALFDHGIGIFNGTIHEIERAPVGEMPSALAWYRCLCVGWDHRLERHRIPCAAFYGKSAGRIVQEIIDTYAAGEVHLGAIQDGLDAATLGTVIYRGISVKDALQDLADKSNYAMWVDDIINLYFVPRGYTRASLSVTAAAKNYRAPKITSTRADYYNSVVLAISHEAFPSRTISFAGDASYPQFDVYDPNSGTADPVGVDIIKSIKLNGVEQSVGVHAADSTATFQYVQGQSTIYWNPTSVPPGPADVITIDFYPIGSNLVKLRDETEISARAAIEHDSGEYQAYMEDLDCKDSTEALARCAAFLNLHAPARVNTALAAGTMPREYKWTMFSHELRSGGTKYVADLWPGTIVRFNPSTPTSEDVEVLLQSVEARDVPGSAPVGQVEGAGMLQYDVTAIDCTKLAGYFEFYKALAEVGGTSSGSPTATGSSVVQVGDELRITLGYSGTISALDGYASVELYLAPGRSLRLNCAVADVETAPVGAAILFDAEYSTDGGTTWTSIYLATSPATYPTIPDGAKQMATPYGQFSAFPTAVDLPARCLVRGCIKQVGSTTAGEGFKQQIIGNIV